MSLSEDKVLNYVQNFMQESWEFRRTYEAMWMKYLGEYLNSRSVKSNPLQRANLKLPYAFTTIETFVPQIVDVFLSEKPYIYIEPQGEEDFEAAEAISNYITYQMDRMQFFKDFVPFVKNMLIYGTGIAKTPWIVKTKEVSKVFYERDSFGIEIQSKKTETQTIYDGPKFDNIDILDFYSDPGCNKPGDVQSMRGCVHRVWRTYDQLKDLEKKDGFGIYHNLDKLKNTIGENGSNAWTNMSRGQDSWAQDKKELLNHQTPGLKNKGKIEVWEYWGTVPNSETSPETNGKEYVITIANGDTVIRYDENPFDAKFKPFIACPNYTIPNEFYGIGEVEIVYSLIKEATALRNARLDQANQAVNRMWIVDRGSGINLRNLYSRSGGIILTNDMNGIRELAAPEVPGSSYKEISQIDYDIQNATSQINASQGASNVGRAFGSTAKGVDYLKSFSATRLSLKVKQIERYVMNDFGKILLMLNRQFVKEDQWVQLFNNDDNPFVKISPEVFLNDYDFFATGAMERLNKEQKQQIFQNNILPFLQVVEQFQPHTIKMDSVVKRFFKDFDYKNPSEYINTPEERERLTQQQQQSQQESEMRRQQMNNETMILNTEIEQQAKAKRDASNLEGKKEIALTKGLFDVASSAIKSNGRDNTSGE